MKASKAKGAIMTPNDKTRPNNDTVEDKGETIPVQGETQDRVPRMPHERDESSSSQSREEPTNQAAVGEQAFKDVENGLVDTSRAAETDATYTKVRKSTDTPDKQFLP